MTKTNCIYDKNLGAYLLNHICVWSNGDIYSIFCDGLMLHSYVQMVYMVIT